MEDQGFKCGLTVSRLPDVTTEQLTIITPQMHLWMDMALLKVK